MNNSNFLPAAAGSLSAILFLLSLSGLAGAGAFLFIHLPVLPLFLLGWHAGVRPVIIAGGLAAIIVVLFGKQANYPLIYLGFSVIPTLIFLYRALMVRHLPDRSTEWYPLVLIACDLMLYMGLIIIGIVLFYQSEPGGFLGFFNREIESTFGQGEEQSKAVAEMFKELNFLLIGINGWVWALMTYLIAMIGFSLLGPERTIRPAFSMAETDLPNWLLGALCLAGIGSFLPAGTTQFLAKTSFILLLLPYFLNTAAQMHVMSRDWPGRTFWLVLIYLFIAISFWPMLFFAGWGVLKQCLSLSKPASSDNTP